MRRMTTGQQKNNRRGSMLIKMVILMTCMSVLIMLSGTLLHRLFRQQITMTSSIMQTGTWSRLARQFRSDVHNASDATVTANDSNTLTLSIADRRITWTSAGNVIRRTEQPEASQAASESLPGEEFLCVDSQVRFAVVRNEARSPLATVQIMTDSTDENSTKASHMKVAAAVGLSRVNGRGASE